MGSIKRAGYKAACSTGKFKIKNVAYIPLELAKRIMGSHSLSFLHRKQQI